MLHGCIGIYLFTRKYPGGSKVAYQLAHSNHQTGHAIFEATHGTAPNIAGKDVVNPCSIILSAVMMLEYFDWKEAAALIEKALEQSFLDARATHDLARFMPNGTSLSTSAFTREIVERIEK